MASSARDPSLLHRVQAILEHWVTRLLLSVAIIVSLVPHDWMHVRDLAFLMIFGPEFVVRLLLAVRSEVAEEGEEADGPRERGWRWPSRWAAILLLLDLVALISFLPLGGGEVAARWLRVFRLSRTVLLFRYWAPLVRDLAAVVTRRERLQQIVLLGAVAALASFAGAVALDHITTEAGEDFDGDGVQGDEHDALLGVRWWWAFRQVQDPGNMMASPHETSTVLISVILTVFGLFLVSFLIGVGTDVVQEVLEVGRLRPVGLTRHTVLVNVTPSTRQLLFELLRETDKRQVDRGWSIRALRSRLSRGFVVVGQHEEEPDFLRDRAFQGVVYRSDPPDDDEAFLSRADVRHAERVVLLADASRGDPDDHSIRTLLTLVEHVREHPEDPRTVQLFAEVLDESNVAAARRAIARAGGRVEAQVVATERLMGLFMACVGRRAGVASLLLDMLDSAGHELYTHRFRSGEGLAGRSGHEAMRSLYRRGVAEPPARRVLPVGVLTDAGGAGIGVALNPGASEGVPGEEVVGFVGIAYDDRAIRSFAARAGDDPAPPMRASAAVRPSFRAAPATPMDRVLVCGWRPGAVNLVEALVLAEPEVELLILVPDEAAVAATLDDFDAQAALIRSGVIDDRYGCFELEGAVLRYRPRAGGPPRGSVKVAASDWTSARRLAELPEGFGRAVDMDLIVFVAQGDASTDARTATALMKLEGLRSVAAREASTGVRPQRVVAELFGTELARRLWRRYEGLEEHDVRVFSVQELRALFMFQSVAVPHFAQVYAELMAPWGQSFTRLLVEPGPEGPLRGPCSFRALAEQLIDEGRLLVALELRDTRGRVEMFVAGADLEADDFDLSALHGVWVVDDELRPPRDGAGAPR